jgi:hypothetical protein
LDSSTAASTPRSTPPATPPATIPTICARRLEQRAGHALVHLLYPGDVDDDRARPVLLRPVEDGVHHRLGAPRVHRPDEGEHHHPVADRDERRRELLEQRGLHPDHLLLQRRARALRQLPLLELSCPRRSFACFRRSLVAEISSVRRAISRSRLVQRHANSSVDPGGLARD